MQVDTLLLVGFYIQILGELEVLVVPTHLLSPITSRISVTVQQSPPFNLTVSIETLVYQITVNFLF
jgi:hypothetical protein